MSDESSPGGGPPGPPSPGSEHRGLHRFAGIFHAQVKIFMGPGDPMVSTGVMENTSELGGLYLRQNYRGDPSPGSELTFQGHGYWGFNQTLGRYEGFWIDNASTTMQLETGHVDASGNRWEMSSEFFLAPGQPPMRKRSVIEWLDNHNHLMRTWIQPPGSPEFLSMEITYRRRD